MIFTRHSLRPFVEMDSIPSHELIARLGSIGLEVESFAQTICSGFMIQYVPAV